MKKPVIASLVGLSLLSITASALPAAAATSDVTASTPVTAGWFDTVKDNLKNIFTPEQNSSTPPAENDEASLRRRGPMRGPGPVGTITSISGDSITMKTRNDVDLTIIVTADTKYLKAIKEPKKHLEEESYSDLAVGDIIGVQPTVKPAKGEHPTTLTALRVVELPELPQPKKFGQQKDENQNAGINKSRMKNIMPKPGMHFED